MLIWFTLAAAGGLAVIIAGLRYRPGSERRDRLAGEFARKADLALPPHLVMPIGERLAMRRRFRFLAVGTGLLVLLALIWIFTATGLVPGSLEDPVGGLTALVFLIRPVDEVVVALC